MVAHLLSLLRRHVRWKLIFFFFCLLSSFVSKMTLYFVATLISLPRPFFRMLSQVAVGLEVERQQLERECNSSQEDALNEESRYHFLQSLCSITEASAQRVRQEER